VVAVTRIAFSRAGLVPTVTTSECARYGFNFNTKAVFRKGTPSIGGWFQHSAKSEKLGLSGPKGDNRKAAKLGKMTKHDHLAKVASLLLLGRYHATKTCSRHSFLTLDARCA
jgi:hypothetical protein